MPKYTGHTNNELCRWKMYYDGCSFVSVIAYGSLFCLFFSLHFLFFFINIISLLLFLRTRTIDRLLQYFCHLKYIKYFLCFYVLSKAACHFSSRFVKSISYKWFFDAKHFGIGYTSNFSSQPKLTNVSCAWIVGIGCCCWCCYSYFIWAYIPFINDLMAMNCEQCWTQVSRTKIYLLSSVCSSIFIIPKFMS